MPSAQPAAEDTGAGDERTWRVPHDHPRPHGRGGSTPPRPSAPDGKPGQWFVFGPWVYDVDAATGWLLRAAPRPPLLIPVQPWACACGLIRDPGSQSQMISLIGPGPGFDPGPRDNRLTRDDPVIIATITTADGEPAGPLLIDGTHRLYKAAVTGREHLPSLRLTAAETLAVRHPIILGPGPRQWAAGTENQP